MSTPGSPNGSTVRNRPPTATPTWTGSDVKLTPAPGAGPQLSSLGIHSPRSSSFSYLSFTAPQATRWRRSSSSYCSSAELYAAWYISWACLGRLFLTLSGRSVSFSYGMPPPSLYVASLQDLSVPDVARQAPAP